MQFKMLIKLYNGFGWLALLSIIIFKKCPAMKKIFTSIYALFLLAVSFASAPLQSTLNPLHASQIIIPVGKGEVKISLLELSKISKPDLEKITGRKMNTVQSVVFKRAQHKIKKGIGSDGIVTDKQIKYLFEDDVKKGFNTGGFLLGENL